MLPPELFPSGAWNEGALPRCPNPSDLTDTEDAVRVFASLLRVPRAMMYEPTLIADFPVDAVPS